MPSRIDPFAAPRKKQASSLLWILEPLERDASHTHCGVFGSDAAYLDGLPCLVAVDRDDP